MALISFLPNSTPNSPCILTAEKRSNKNHTTTTNKKSQNSKKIKKQPHPPPHKSSSWEQFKSLLSCKDATTASSQTHAPSPIKNPNKITKHARLGSTCGSSICANRDVIHATTRVTDHGSSSSSDSGPHVSDTSLLTTARSRGGGGGGMQLMKLSGCYECHAVDVHSASRRYPRPRTLCPCTECGEVFAKSESLELHQAIRHAVSELGPEDSGRNVVEIIFKSSWQKKETPICTIDRILKVHNTQRTITLFEGYRDAVKARARAHLLPTQPKSKNPRCAADGNELLRFHCTSISCSLGSNASTSLCLSSAGVGPCSACTIIRNGFSRAQQNIIIGPTPTGVLTTASSGRAHDWGPQVESGPGAARRAMLVCRVIAGRVERSGGETMDGSGPFDSVAGDESLEELFVANPIAILPCFVVIYKST